MIRELKVCARKLELGHMASGAIFFSHGTRSGADLSATVAGHAFGIVVGRIGDDLLVRVVTCQTTDTRIVGVVALALGQAVGLKSNIRN